MPSDPDLCRDLFYSVIENLEDDDALYDFDKSTVSRILKGERKIPSIVRDHIYDDCVEKGIADYFSKFIIPQLVPDHSDLIHELITLLEKYPNISKPHLSTLKSIAKENSFGVFLSEVYRYAVIEGTGNNSDEFVQKENKATVDFRKEPVLSLCGIAKNDSLSASFVIESVADKTNISREVFREKLRNQYEEISNIHLLGEHNPLIINGKTFSFDKRAEISEKTKTTIKQVAEILRIQISDDFFELGGLSTKTNTLSASILLGGGPELNGTPEEKHKYDLIHKTEDMIYDFARAIPFIDAFENIKFVRLAVKNSGTMHDENVSITLSFNKGALLTIEEIADMSNDVYDYIMNECNQQKVFGIDRGVDYLDYKSSIKGIKPINISVPSLTNPLGIKADKIDDIDRKERLEDYLDYYISTQNNQDIVKINIDEIIHNDAVAFPSILMLKTDVDSIEYTIHSKYMTEQVKGKIMSSNSK